MTVLVTKYILHRMPLTGHRTYRAPYLCLCLCRSVNRAWLGTFHRQESDYCHRIFLLLNCSHQITFRIICSHCSWNWQSRNWVTIGQSETVSFSSTTIDIRVEDLEVAAGYDTDVTAYVHERYTNYLTGTSLHSAKKKDLRVKVDTFSFLPLRSTNKWL